MAFALGLGGRGGAAGAGVSGPFCPIAPVGAWSTIALGDDDTLVAFADAGAPPAAVDVALAKVGAAVAEALCGSEALAAVGTCAVSGVGGAATGSDGAPAPKSCWRNITTPAMTAAAASQKSTRPPAPPFFFAGAWSDARAVPEAGRTLVGVSRELRSAAEGRTAGFSSAAGGSTASGAACASSVGFAGSAVVHSLAVAMGAAFA